MKIGLVLSSAPGYSETFFKNKIKGLQENGHEVILFLDYQSDKEQNLPYKTVSNFNFQGNLLKKPLGILKIFWKSILSHPNASYRLLRLEVSDGRSIKDAIRTVILNEFLLSEPLDWLHYGFGMLAHNRENVADAINAKMAVSFRGFDLYLSPLKHPGCYTSLFEKQVKYHVLSNEMKDSLLKQNISSHKITVIPPAIDVSFFNSSKTKGAKSVLQLVTVARLHWKKGLEYTIEALGILKKQNISFHFKIIGIGEELERLVFAAHQLEVLDCVEFVGKLKPTEVKQALDNADIYLQYSIQEGFCNAVIEAQAMGLLCIVSDAEGLSENILDSKTGWVVPKRKPILLAEKIKEVLSMSNLEKERITNNAIARAKQSFSLELQKKAFNDFFS